MKPFLIVANWKANKTVEEARVWWREFYSPSGWEKIKPLLGRIEIIYAVPYTLLAWFDGPHWDAKLAAQDISPYPAGSYTGAIPGSLLKNLSVEYCLIGHSERRKYFHETNNEVEAKMKQAIDNGIIPIICAQTLEEIPPNIRNYNPDQYLIMYEPSSAISTDGVYHPESPDNIKAILSDWQSKLNLQCRFLYGGSVSPSNCYELRTTNSALLSGFVVGHASLDASEFSRIIQAVAQSL